MYKQINLDNTTLTDEQKNTIWGSMKIAYERGRLDAHLLSTLMSYRRHTDLIKALGEHGIIEKHNIKHINKILSDGYDEDTESHGDECESNDAALLNKELEFQNEFISK